MMETLETCGFDAATGCDWILNEIGPPPNSILSLPPPPLPQFLTESLLQDLGFQGEVENDTLCHLCQWARRIDSDTVEVPSGTEMALEDTWFFVILASCLMLTLGALLTGLIYLRLHGKTLKATWDFGSLASENGSSIVSGKLSHKSCQQVRYSASGDSLSGAVSTFQRSVTRALWAGVKTTEGNHYTITHVQPIEQKRPTLHAIGHEADEDSVGYTTLDTGTHADNKIYYCSTDLMTGLCKTEPTKVTSLDDIDVIPTNSPNGAASYSNPPIYVNAAAFNPVLSRQRQDISHPIVCVDSNFPPLNSRPFPRKNLVNLPHHC